MEQMSLISKKKGERIDKFLGENLDDLSRSYICLLYTSDAADE